MIPDGTDGKPDPKPAVEPTTDTTAADTSNGGNGTGGKGTTKP